MSRRYAFLQRDAEADGAWTEFDERDSLPSAGDEVDIPDDVLHELAILDTENATIQDIQGNGLADVYPNAVAAYSAVGASAVNSEGIITARRVADGATRDFSVFDVHSGTLEEWADGGDVALVLNDVSGNGNDTSQGTDSAEPIIVKSGVLVSMEERPGIRFDGSDDALTASVAVGDTVTVAIDFESAFDATYPATVYSHDGVTVRETATDIEVEITDGTNTQTVTEPKLDLNRVVLTATPTNVYVCVNGEESSASHAITRTDNSTLDLGNGSFEGRVGHAVVWDQDRWSDRQGIVDRMGGLWSPPSRVRWDFGRTNLFYESEELGAFGYTREDSTLTSNTGVTDPDGVEGKKLTNTSANGDANYRHTSAEESSPGTYLFFADVKPAERPVFRLNIFGGDANAADMHFDLDSLTVSNVDGEFEDTGIFPLGDGWYRCALLHGDGGGDTAVDFLWVDNGEDGGGYVSKFQKELWSETQFDSDLTLSGIPEYTPQGPKPQSLAPDVGPSKFSFSVGSDDTAVDTNDPWITPDGVKGDGVDDYLTLTAEELNPDRDFTWIIRYKYSLKDDGNAYTILGIGDSTDEGINIREENGLLQLSYRIDNTPVHQFNITETADDNYHTLAFTLDDDRLTGRLSVDGGSVSSGTFSQQYKSEVANDLYLFSATNGNFRHSNAEITALEHIPRALTDRELRAACNALTDPKRNSISRVYPTYAWDFQHGEGQFVPSKIGGAPQIQLGSDPGVDTNDPTWTARGLKGDGVDDYAELIDPAINPVDNFSWVQVFDIPLASENGNRQYTIELGDYGGDHGFKFRREQSFNDMVLTLRHTDNTNQDFHLGHARDGIQVFGFSLSGGQVYGTLDGEPVRGYVLPTGYTQPDDNRLRFLHFRRERFFSVGTIIDTHFYDTALSPDALLHATKELYRKRA